MYICVVKRFLIIQTAFLGDVILSTPIISELNRIYPESKIDVVVRKGNETLLENNPKINQILVWNKKNGKYKSLWATIKAIRKHKYDEVITLQRYSNAGLMTLFAKSHYKIGFNRNAFSWIYTKKIPHSLTSGQHEVERNLATIAHHGAQSLIRPELYPSASDWETVSYFSNQTYYCLAPASVWETKKLPTEKWMNLIQILIQKGKVILIGGPDDSKLCEDLQKEFPRDVHNLAGQLTLLQSAALMKNAKMNYVNDSGPLHIASAMNAPTRAFFCSTVPLFGFGPLAEDSKIIETPKKLACRPCGFHGHKKCPLGHFDCGHTIEISEKTI